MHKQTCGLEILEKFCKEQSVVQVTIPLSLYQEWHLCPPSEPNHFVPPKHGIFSFPRRCCFKGKSRETVWSVFQSIVCYQSFRRRTNWTKGSVYFPPASSLCVGHTVLLKNSHFIGTLWSISFFLLVGDVFEKVFFMKQDMSGFQATEMT